MGTEITTMQALQDKVKERIRASFNELIPEEMWDGLVNQNIDVYMKVEFPALVKEMAKAEIAHRVQAEFAKPAWQHQWDSYSGHNTASEMVGRIVREAAPVLVQEMFSSMVQNVVNAIRNNQVPRY